MKVGKWRVEFKTTITGKYKNIKDVPYWRAYIVRRERKYLIDKNSGEVLHEYKGQVVHLTLWTMTYDELVSEINKLDWVQPRGGERISPDVGGYIVAYPRESQKGRKSQPSEVYKYV